MRLAWPGILAASIYIFMTAFAAFDVPAIIGWGNRIFTFTTYLYLLLNPQDVLPKYGLRGRASRPSRWRSRRVMSCWYGRMQARSRRFAVVTGRAYRPKIIRLGRRVYAAWLFIGSYLVLSKLLPILLLIWSSLLPFFQLPSATRRSRSCRCNHYASLPWEIVFQGARQHRDPRRAGADRDARDQRWRSPGSCCARRIRGRGGFDFIAFLPHAVPSIVFGVGALLARAVRAAARGADLRHDLSSCSSCS